MVDSNCENSKVITAHFSKIHENWTDRLILGVTVGEFELLEIHHFKSKLLRKAFSSVLKFGQTHKNWSPPAWG